MDNITLLHLFKMISVDYFSKYHNNPQKAAMSTQIDHAK